MATKVLLPNQHVPLHYIYGHNDCCLCRAEHKIATIKSKIMDAIILINDADVKHRKLDRKELLKKLNSVINEI